MGYITEIRKKIGHDIMFMPASGGCIIQKNKILLQRRKDNGTWAMHGGSLEIGETFEEALYRELKEELNIVPKNPQFINVYSGKELIFTYPNQDRVCAISAAYLIEEYDGKIKIDQNEVSEVKWFDLENIPINLNPPDVLPIKDIIHYYIEKKNPKFR